MYSLRTSDGQVRWRTRPTARSRARWRSPDGKLFFGDYGGKVHAIRAGRRRQGLGEGVRRRGPRASAAATSTPPPRSPTAASTSAARAAPCTRSRRRTARSPGATPPAATSTRRPPWARGPAGGRRSSSAPTTAASTPSTRSPAGRAGRGTWAARSRGRRASSATSSSSPTSGTKSSWALGAGTGATVWKTGRGAFNPVISDGRRIYFNGYSPLRARPRGHPLRPAEEAVRATVQTCTTSASRRGRRHRPPAVAATATSAVA